MKLTEGEIKSIVYSAVKRILNEGADANGLIQKFIQNIRQVGELAYNFYFEHKNERDSIKDQYASNRFLDSTQEERTEISNKIVPLLKECEQLYNQISQVCDPRDECTSIYNFMQGAFQRTMSMAEELPNTTNYDYMLLQYTKNVLDSNYLQGSRNLNEINFFRRKYWEGKPQKASDVLLGNNWTARIVEKEKGRIVIRCYRDGGSMFGHDDPLPFDELVEDLNIYYEDKGSPLRARGMDGYNGQEGSYIEIK